jgi:acyl-CoA reductase-like NAD-dependent aldehyde dehydrogenase
MPENVAARRALEREWDRKLQQARERYFKAAGELHRQVFDSSAPLEAGSPVLAATRQQEAAAFAEYCRVLATYTELTINGKLPEPPSSQVAGAPRNPE